MKRIILILFVLINTVMAYDTHEEIDAVKVNDVLMILLDKSYPTCKYSFQKNQPMEFEFLVNDSTIEQCNEVIVTEEIITETATGQIITPAVKKMECIQIVDESCAATLPVLQEKLDELKTKAHNDLAYKIILDAKKLEAKNLYSEMKYYYHRAADRTALPNISNPDLWVKKNCEDVKTHEDADDCLNKLKIVNDKVIEVKAEIAAEEAAKNECNINVEAIQNFDLETFENYKFESADGVAEMKTKHNQSINMMKNMARIMKCRIK